MDDMTRHRSPIVVLATLVWLFAISTGVASAASPAPSAPPPGPPFPAPEVDRAVYDYAGILSPEAIAAAEATIDGIEARTGSEVVVYTQDSGTFPSTDETEAKARALMDQWGVGRKGFNDGLVIFFDMQPNLEHGQVQLYAGPGFEAAFLSNEERQAIFQNDMLPSLAAGDFDGALAAALEKVDAAATPEHADALQRSRQINAVVGLVGGSVVFLGLTGWALFSWRRYGKDPVYLDDPSVLMPAPPPDLTAASGAMIMDGATSRRALTTAMLDLASRGYIAFRDQPGVLFAGHKVGVDVAPAAGDADTEAQRRLNQRRPTGPGGAGRAHPAHRPWPAGADGFISPDDLPKFGSHVGEFDTALEDHVVDRGWFGERPSKVVSRWAGRGTLAIVGGRHRGDRRAQHPAVRAHPARRGRDRGWHRGRHHRPVDAGGDDHRLDDPGDAGRLSADAPEDDGAGSIDAAGRRRSRPGLARYPRSGGRLGDRAGTPGRDRGRPVAQPRGRQGGPDQRRRALLPDLVPDLERDAVHELGRRRQRGEPVLRFGHPRRRRDDVGSRDDRELSGIVGRWRWWWRLRRRLVRRWRGRSRRRVLGPPSGCQAPNMSRQASKPSIANGGRGRDRHSSSVIRKFCVVRATPSGARLP